MNYTDKNTLNKIDSLKSALDRYRPFPEHIVKQRSNYYHIEVKHKDD